jgi:hypothetical protein
MPQGGATLEQAASVKHYLMKKPLSGDVPKSRVLFGRTALYPPEKGNGGF